MSYSDQDNAGTMDKENTGQDSYKEPDSKMFTKYTENNSTSGKMGFMWTKASWETVVPAKSQQVLDEVSPSVCPFHDES